MPFGYDASFDVADLGSLSAVGTTSAQKTTGASLSFQVKVANIGTNVVVRFEGSIDGEDYFNLSLLGDFTITSNGVAGYFIVAPVQFIRLRLVSISGGSPVISCKVGVI